MELGPRSARILGQWTLGGGAQPEPSGLMPGDRSPDKVLRPEAKPLISRGSLPAQLHSMKV